MAPRLLPACTVTSWSRVFPRQALVGSGGEHAQVEAPAWESGPARAPPALVTTRLRAGRNFCACESRQQGSVPWTWVRRTPPGRPRAWLSVTRTRSPELSHSCTGEDTAALQMRRQRLGKVTSLVQGDTGRPVPTGPAEAVATPAGAESRRFAAKERPQLRSGKSLTLLGRDRAGASELS